MNQEQHDKALEQAIRRAVGSETAEFDAQRWMRAHPAEMALLQSRQTTPAPAQVRRGFPWRFIMQTRTVKFGVPAAVALLVALWLWLGGGGGGVSPAMATVLEQLHSQSYEFVMEVPGNQTVKVLGRVLEPGRLRLEMTHDSLGLIVSVFDSHAGQALMLYERTKVAQRLDMQAKETMAALGFFLLPGRSVSDLWNLQADGGTKLRQEKMEGHDAQVYQVAQQGEGYTQTITIWADVQTSAPLRVDMVCQPSEENAAPVHLMLHDFKIVSKPDPALFSTEVPAGYTLANQRTLDQLTQGSAAGAAAATTSAEAEKIWTALQQCHDGNLAQAVATLRTVDWTGDILFGSECYLFSMTEGQFIALVKEDQTKVLAAVMAQVNDAGKLTRALIDRAHQDQEAQKTTDAEECLHAAAEMGRRLHLDKDRLSLARIFGISVESHAVDELAKLYQAQGRTDKWQETQQRMKELHEEADRIKKRTTGK